VRKQPPLDPAARVVGWSLVKAAFSATADAPPNRAPRTLAGVPHLRPFEALLDSASLGIGVHR
jgi:hypothetical protein